MFLHACMHYDLFIVVRPQSVVFESCVTRVPQISSCVCHFGLNFRWTVRSFCTLYAHFHVLQPLS